MRSHYRRGSGRPHECSILVSCRYSIDVLDFKTRYILHDVLRHQNEASWIFKRFLIQIRVMGYKVQRVRVDDDFILLSVEFLSLLDEFGIALQRTTPYGSMGASSGSVAHSYRWLWRWFTVLVLIGATGLWRCIQQHTLEIACGAAEPMACHAIL